MRFKNESSLVGPGRLWRAATLGQQNRALVTSHFFRVIENLLDYHWVFDAAVRGICNRFHRATAISAGLDIDVVNTLEPMDPCHRRSPLRWR